MLLHLGQLLHLGLQHMDSDIELTVSSCSTCQFMRSDPSPIKLYPCTFPVRLWSCIHVDFAGPISCCIYLLLVDAYSKFPEVVKMCTTSAKATVTSLCHIFSRQGLPKIIVSDNGPQLTLTEFEQFCVTNGILHHVVEILKSAIKQAHLTDADVNAVIANHLSIYQTMPHPTTGEPPSLLLMGQRLLNWLDLLTPSIEKHVEAHQYHTMLSPTAHRGFLEFIAGEAVLP